LDPIIVDGFEFLMQKYMKGLRVASATLSEDAKGI